MGGALLVESSCTRAVWRLPIAAPLIVGIERPVRLTSDEFDTIVGVANYALSPALILNAT